MKQMKSLEQVDRTDSELKKLCELVDFGADCMNKGGIPSPHHLRGAKQHFFMLLVVAHNYLESVCVLCKQGRTHAAFELLRPVCECLIKAKYLYCNTTLHLWELRLEAFVEKRKQLNGIKELLISGKYLGGKSDYLRIDDVEQSLDKTQSSEKYCLIWTCYNLTLFLRFFPNFMKVYTKL